MNDLFPLLIRYKVDIYFSGHVHLLQHVKKLGLEMIGSGAGGKIIKHSECVVGLEHDNGTKVLGLSEAALGFVVLDVSKSIFRIQFHRVGLERGEHSVVYETTIEKRKQEEEEQKEDSFSLQKLLINRLRKS